MIEPKGLQKKKKKGQPSELLWISCREKGQTGQRRLTCHKDHEQCNNSNYHFGVMIGEGTW